MKQLLINIEGPHCTAWLNYGSATGVGYTTFILPDGLSWLQLLEQLHEKLQLSQHTPPGMLTVGDEDAARAPLPWAPLEGGFGLPGWGWGFWLPVVRENAEARLHESCCGFRSREAAAKAAQTLQMHHARIYGDLPNGVFEIFQLDGAHAFLDVLGELHATFPTHAEARGCAGKLEAQQMQPATATPAA